MRARRWMILGLAIAAQSASVITLFGVPFLIPELRADTGISLGAAGAVVASPGFGLMATLVLWGAVADRYGERLAMTVGLAMSGLFSALAATTDGPVALGAVLAMAGASGAAVNAASGRVVLGWFDAHERGLAMGARQSALPLGLAVSSLTLPVLAQRWGYQSALLLPAGLCLVVSVLLGLFLADPPRQAAVGQATGASPYRTSGLWRVHGASALLVVPQVAVSTFAYVYLVEEHGWGAGQAGAVLAVTQVAGAAARLLAGHWSDRVASRLRPMRVLAVVNALVMAALALGGELSGTFGVAALLVASVITMSGNGLAFTAVAEMAGRSWAGRALGLQNTGQNLAASLTAPVLGVAIGAIGYQMAYAAVIAFPLLAVPAVPVRAETGDLSPVR